MPNARLKIGLTTLIVASLLTAEAGEAVRAQVVAVGDEFANIDTDASAEDVAGLGIEQGSRFVFDHRGERRSATLVADYAEVDRGAWLGMIQDGRLRLAISFGNACPEIECEVGDEVSISSAPEDPSPAH